MHADIAERATAAHATSRSSRVFPRDLKLRDRSALIAVLLGMALLWPLPLGGVLLMVAGTFGLAISWEDELIEARVSPPAPRRKETQ
jgi:hypothetical protein